MIKNEMIFHYGEDMISEGTRCYTKKQLTRWKGESFFISLRLQRVLCLSFSSCHFASCLISSLQATQISSISYSFPECPCVCAPRPVLMGELSFSPFPPLPFSWPFRFPLLSFPPDLNVLCARLKLSQFRFTFFKFHFVKRLLFWHNYDTSLTQQVAHIQFKPTQQKNKANLKVPKTAAPQTAT